MLVLISCLLLLLLYIVVIVVVVVAAVVPPVADIQRPSRRMRRKNKSERMLLFHHVPPFLDTEVFVRIGEHKNESLLLFFHPCGHHPGIQHLLFQKINAKMKDGFAFEI